MTTARAVARVAGSLAAYAVLVRPRLRRWGASVTEARQALPGDELVAARWQTTRGVALGASAREVWPWLVQMGYGRAGWYSYDELERLVHAGTFADGGSARRVIPELQSLAVGDAVALSAAGGLVVSVLVPESALVLHMVMNVLTGAPAGPHDPAVLDWTWSFVLVPAGAHSCRLLARVRADYRPRGLVLLLVALVEPVHFLMERKMLRTLQQQIECRP